MEKERSTNYRVTVLLPTYNREKLLKEAIESLFKQTLHPSEFVVLVIDNCSTDNTPAMIEEIRKELPLKSSIAGWKPMAVVFALSTLGWKPHQPRLLRPSIATVGQTRKWLETGLAGFEQDPEVAFVAGHIGDKQGQRVGFFSLRNGAPTERKSFYPSGNCFYRQSIVRKFGGFDENLAVWRCWYLTHWLR